MSLYADSKTVPDSDKKTKENSTMCLELALEGERLCKSGECRAGIAFFQAAIDIGTDDPKTLSAICSQLGNAYFYLGNYTKALHFHKRDLTLSKSLEDKAGEAKSCGNLGNTFKVMGNYDEAIVYCERHLELARELNDKNSEARALYNLGNVYHSKGKACGRQKQGTNFELSLEAKRYLKEAIRFYLDNLEIMNDLGDMAAQGRSCGNLGNTYYLLGNFEEAIIYHKKRLDIAKFYADKAAERRAHNNMGNCYIFLGDFHEATFHYKRTLTLAVELNDRAIEAQACYSLGNTYTLLRDFETAIEYHLMHLIIAQELIDKVGESRAYWSLSNAYMALENPQKALYFAQKHYDLSNDLNDSMSLKLAKINIDELEKIVNGSGCERSSVRSNTSRNGSILSSSSSNKIRRDSMDQMNLLRLTPDKKQTIKSAGPTKLSNDQESFLDLLETVQSRRMDEQRVVLPPKNELNIKQTVQQKSTVPDEDFFSLIIKMQSERMEDQRATIKSSKK